LQSFLGRTVSTPVLKLDVQPVFAFWGGPYPVSQA
jgi:hypothetical protein